MYAGVGLIVANFLKYQGLCFAKNLPDNQQTIKDYYNNTYVNYMKEKIDETKTQDVDNVRILNKKGDNL